MKKKGTRHLAWQTILGIFDASVMVFVGLLIMGVLFYRDVPDVSNLNDRYIPQTSIIYDRSGEHVLYELHGEENRKLLPHDQIPDVMRIATIAAEDDSFYSHFGLDFKSIARAFKVNVENDEISQGASTITQQLARSIFLTREKTWMRKLREAALAVKIEKLYSKDEILDMYLNQVPYGSNAYGIQTAAETFFGKGAEDLTLDEAVFLAALPKAPTHYSPYGENKNELAARQKEIIKRMSELKLADNKELLKAYKEDTLSRVVPRVHPIDTPHFVFYVIDRMGGKYSRQEIEEGGMRIITTLDYDMQKRAEEIVREGADLNAKRYNATNAALVAVDPGNGEILAMVGSKDYFDDGNDGQVNVTIRQRQPGSAFKPVVYAEAFEKGYQPETLIYDVRTNFGPDGSGRDYIPNNYNGQFNGLVTMRKALAGSLNVPAVKTLYLSGIDGVIDMAERLGITTLTERNKYGLSLALGGGAINLLEGTSAFSVFANDGIRNQTISVKKITDAEGNLIYEPRAEGIRVVDEQVARKINSVLSDNSARSFVFGPSSSLYIPGKSVAAKTGTTQDYRDGWTIGYTPNLAVGVWAGNNDNRPMRAGSAGLYVASPMWNKFMREFMNTREDVKFADYTRSKSTVPMLSGEPEKAVAYYRKGKKLDGEKIAKTDPDKIEEKQEAVQHSLLYYLNSGEFGDFDSSMIKRWEEALGRKEDANN